MRWQPYPKDLKKIIAECEQQAKKGKNKVDELLRDNLLFQRLYHHKDGIWPRTGAKATWKKDEAGEWQRYKRNMSRREWIEANFPVRAKDGQIVKLVLNPAQRRLEAKILRMERAGVPVRIIILKARKMGFSTYVQALTYEQDLRGENVRGLIIADNEKRSSLLLQIADVARQHMTKPTEVTGGKEKQKWYFRFTSKAKYSIAWDEPIYSEIEITSASTESPGRGATPTIIHGSETAWWKDAAASQASAFSALPALPGTFGFDESTANGDTGKFHDDFQEAWKQCDVPLCERSAPWDGMFFAWFEDPGYRWTREWGLNRTLPVSMIEQIESSLTDEEEWLLKQTYLQRWTPDDEWVQVRTWEYFALKVEDGKIVGTQRVRSSGPTKWRRRTVGQQPVTVDQLAWRRTKILDKEIGGDMDLFNREYPSRPEVAFLSSGSPVFDPAAIHRYEVAAASTEPVFRGYLVPDEAA